MRLATQRRQATRADAAPPSRETRALQVRAGRCTTCRAAPRTAEVRRFPQLLLEQQRMLRCRWYAVRGRAVRAAPAARVSVPRDRSCREHNRQFCRTAEGGVRAPLNVIVCKLDAGQAAQQRAQGGRAFNACQRSAETEVTRPTERQVSVLGATDVQQLRIDELRG